MVPTFQKMKKRRNYSILRLIRHNPRSLQRFCESRSFLLRKNVIEIKYHKTIEFHHDGHFF